MFRVVILAVAFGSVVATATAADQQSKASGQKLSDDAKKLIACCNQLMERDYEDEVHIRIVKTWKPFHKMNSSVGEQERILRKFTKGYLIPRSRSRLVAYVSKYSPSEIRDMNELMTSARRTTKAEDKRFSEITDDLIKIEDAVLNEIPKSKFPKFD